MFFFTHPRKASSLIKKGMQTDLIAIRIGASDRLLDTHFTQRGVTQVTVVGDSMVRFLAAERWQSQCKMVVISSGGATLGKLANIISKLGTGHTPGTFVVHGGQIMLTKHTTMRLKPWKDVRKNWTL